jgi:two-component system, NarL family, sensor histidine kinase UhpB
VGGKKRDVMKPSYRLLLVEDSADDAELLLYSLRDAPFNFTAVRVETEAEYDAALDTEPMPDVVLCDYHLPRFSADLALQILQLRHLNIPFLVVSHHIGEDAAVAAMQNGASDYLLKSRLGRLSMAIEAAIERRDSRQQKSAVEAALLASEAMKRGILNSLSTRIAVLDGNGVIVATNKAWEHFDDTRGRMDEKPAPVGVNYLELAEEAAGRGDPLAERRLRDMRSVINREAKFASMEYELSAPGGTRWFLARVMPLEDSTDGAVISHEDVTDRMQAHHALNEANKRLQAISKRVLSIQEEERRSISRELHDDIGQSLTALKIGLHRIAQRASADSKELVAECLNIADSTLDKLRNLSLELRPPQLDQLGLGGALEWLVDHHRSATGLNVECQFAGLSDRLPAEIESACYRITQEALNNATRHASAKQIHIRVERGEHLLMLVIRDDGVGFDMDEARRKALRTGSMGLIGMEERAQLAGGRLMLCTVPGMGTAVQVTFALEHDGGPIDDGHREQNLTGALWG